MSLWEYKILTSGALGFGSASLLEQHLNQLGKDQWEIISWQTAPQNPLIFQGLARRPILRDWFPETSEMSHAPRRLEIEEKAEAEAAGEVEPPEQEDRTVYADDVDEEKEGDDDLPSLFDALRPYLRRNKHGPGWSVELSFLARKFEQDEKELVAAFVECGLPVPQTTEEKPVYVESDGSVYWLNRNQRGQIWINAKELPKGKHAPKQSEPPAERITPPPAQSPTASLLPKEREGAPAVAVTQNQTIPLVGDGTILDQLKGMMRRNRRGHGYSGNISFLARALNQDANQLVDALVAVGIRVPSDVNDRTPGVEWDGNVYWFNKNQGGQLWLNGRPKRGGGSSPGQETEMTSSDETTENRQLNEPAPLVNESSSMVQDTTQIATEPNRSAPVDFTVLRPLLKKKKTGSGEAAKISELAAGLDKDEGVVVSALDALGLKLPETAKSKPTFAEHAGEIFWLNKNTKGEIWLNAKEQAKRKSSKPKTKKKTD